MFPHPRPDVRALDASRIHAPVRGGDSPCFYTFTLFYTFSVGEKSKNRWNSNVFIAFFFYTFTFFLSLTGRASLKVFATVGIIGISHAFRACGRAEKRMFSLRLPWSRCLGW